MTELDGTECRAITGRDVDNAAPTEADHHMKCPGCGRWFDVRDLGEVVEHVHDTVEIKMEERPVFRLSRLRP